MESVFAMPSPLFFIFLIVKHLVKFVIFVLENTAFRLFLAFFPLRDSWAIFPNLCAPLRVFFFSCSIKSWLVASRTCLNLKSEGKPH